MDPEEVRRTISSMMNSGLSGKNLRASILSRYTISDLQQVKEVVVAAAVNDGVQGNYFIDPTAYGDYGHGCSSGSKLFRKQGASNLLASTKCNGCFLETAPGWCSKYAKSLIRNVPDDIRAEIAAARKAASVEPPKVTFENPVEKYELSSDMTIDIGDSKPRNFEISLNSRDID